MSPPVYGALKDRCIRLLILHPAKQPSSPIECSFFLVPLDEKPKYESLSYVWGSETLSSAVKIEDSDVRITESLFHALISLRSRQRHRQLWVDALCINQDNHEERIEQIGLMNKIYHQAENVIVYLGEAWNGHDIAFDFLELAARESQTHFEPSLEPHLQIRGLDISNPVLRDVMIRLFVSEWFQRVWTVQEFVLAKRHTFHCGSTSLDGQLFLDGYRNLRQHASDVCCGTPAYILEKSPKYETNLFFALSCMNPLYELRLHAGPRTFLDTLVEYRLQKCSDPRDRIYGILGMPFNGNQTQIIPDYTISIERLYIEVAKEQIEQTRTLDILSHVLPATKSALNLPSYIPDWSVGPSRLSYLRYTERVISMEHYHAASAVPADFCFVSDHEASVKGTVTDIIEEVGSPSSGLNIENGLQMKAIVDEARTLARLPSQGPSSFEDANEREAALWRTLTGNMTQFPKDGHRGVKLADAVVDYASFVTWNKVMEGHMRGDLEVASADVETFGHTLLPQLADRRFMRTRTGNIGVVPKDCGPGDLVAVLAGGRVPYILRRLAGGAGEDSSPMYTFLGDAYVEGLMYGAAVSEGVLWSQLRLK